MENTMLHLINALARRTALTAALIALGATATSGGNLPTEMLPLGTVHIPTDVLAGGNQLPAGTYQVRLTGEHVEPAVPGQHERLERWVEYMRGNTVVATALAVVVPATQIAQVADDRRPAPGTHRVDRLKGRDYLRVWFNHQGDHILLHHPIAAPGAEGHR
jgi:hypothetical protein